MRYKLLCINKRFNILEIIVIILFFIIGIYIIKNLYNKNSYYSDKLNILKNKLVYGESAPRGRIYDRNNNILVDNKEILEITYKKDKNINIKDEINLAYKVSSHLDLDYSKVNIDDIKRFYILKYPDLANNKITKKERKDLKERKLSNSDIENLKLSRINESDLAIFNESDIKASYIYYLMNNGYSYSEKVIKKDVSYLEYAYFIEHIDELNGFNTRTAWERVYPYGDTFKSILGTVGSIPKELKKEYLKSGYNLNDIVGLSNIEQEYENYLKGEKAVYRKVSNNNLELISDSIKGNDIILNIDINLIKSINEIIDYNLIKAKSEANTEFLNKTYVIIQKPDTGEILAISGRQIINNNGNLITTDITPYALTDPMAPGSVIKGASMLVGYNTGVINIGEETTDECIKLYNIPKKCSSHRVGRLNDITALAESSNVYQFKIAMKVAGINYTYNTKATVDESSFNTYRKVFNQFGLGVKTEIDLPIESIGYIGNKIEPDLLLNYSIGQYDTYTPIQLSQYITTIANGGNRLRPMLLNKVILKDKAISFKPIVLNKVETKKEYLNRVKEGFNAVMDYGLGKNVMGNSPNPAGKTGTSESFIDTNNDGKIDTETVSNAFVGYAPRDNPAISITITTPDVENPNTSINHRSYVNRRIVKEISNMYFSDYFNK